MSRRLITVDESGSAVREAMSVIWSVIGGAKQQADLRRQWYSGPRGKRASERATVQSVSQSASSERTSCLGPCLVFNIGKVFYFLIRQSLARTSCARPTASQPFTHSSFACQKSGCCWHNGISRNLHRFDRRTLPSDAQDFNVRRYLERVEQQLICNWVSNRLANYWKAHNLLLILSLGCKSAGYRHRTDVTNYISPLNIGHNNYTIISF